MMTADQLADLLEAIAIGQQTSTAAVVRAMLVIDDQVPDKAEISTFLRLHLAGQLERADRLRLIDLVLYLRILDYHEKYVGYNHP